MGTQGIASIAYKASSLIAGKGWDMSAFTCSRTHMETTQHLKSTRVWLPQYHADESKEKRVGTVMSGAEYTTFASNAKHRWARLCRPSHLPRCTQLRGRGSVTFHHAMGSSAPWWL